MYTWVLIYISYLQIYFKLSFPVLCVLLIFSTTSGSSVFSLVFYPCNVCLIHSFFFGIRCRCAIWTVESSTYVKNHQVCALSRTIFNIFRSYADLYIYMIFLHYLQNFWFAFTIFACISSLRCPLFFSTSETEVNFLIFYL